MKNHIDIWLLTTNLLLFLSINRTYFLSHFNFGHFMYICSKYSLSFVLNRQSIRYNVTVVFIFFSFIWTQWDETNVWKGNHIFIWFVDFCMHTHIHCIYACATNQNLMRNEIKRWGGKMEFYFFYWSQWIPWRNECGWSLYPYHVIVKVK